MDDKRFLEELVKRYVANALSREELDVFFRLMAEGKLDDALAGQLDKESGAGAERVKPLHLHPWSTVSKTFRVAASVLLVLSIALGIWKYNPFQLLGNKVLVVTGKGEKKEIKLPDGSLVWLNESSRMEYPRHFEDHRRKVVLLDGEAYFDIMHDKTKPFYVEASGTTTRVLGTAFNIRSYHFLKSIWVTVTRGKVEVQKAGGAAEPDKKILLPNEQVYYDIDTREIKKVTVNSANAVAWKEGKLLFDNERFGNVIAILENKFDVKILAEESIREYHMSAEFASTDSLPRILDLLSLANNLEYRMQDHQITLSKRRKTI
ncbi:anti-sigma factor [Dyadobacter beijingensis]|uniref:Anti-sigma factor n=1 Tax=Dyadobacter beijingensis TaxID=365489 RepID=A0ABQ2IAQ5_9BACT|nr:FecR domain-containing protein [Dyadobacter beijingensis]GGN04844.1 anti-sigma factor [Dyadobacter beijingensis]